MNNKGLILCGCVAILLFIAMIGSLFQFTFTNFLIGLTLVGMAMAYVVDEPKVIAKPEPGYMEGDENQTEARRLDSMGQIKDIKI